MGPSPWAVGGGLNRSNKWTKIWGISENRGTPKSSHFNGVFHYFHHPFWGPTPIFGNIPLFFFDKGEVDVFVLVEDEKSDINIFSGVRHEEVVFRNS